ncbi:hypothetical protein FQW43_26580 [Salmonella enterica subsp. enterica serovar Enteritidis]|nr:hypothetical protein [Salmonella enterica subsp. enterica serovar Enteritidis]
MSVEYRKPESIYPEVSQVVMNILHALPTDSTDESLQKTNADARGVLEKLLSKLNKNIANLKDNAVWDRFTVAFYGETNAGKSIIIETLRILLKEESKLQRQKTFREFQQQHHITDADIEKLQKLIDDNKSKAEELHRATEFSHSQYGEKEEAASFMAKATRTTRICQVTYKTA